MHNINYIRDNPVEFDNFMKSRGENSISQKIIDIFKGNDDDFSKAVSLNAAAGLIISEREDNFKYAYEKARDHLLSGRTYSHLEKPPMKWLK